MRRLVLLLLLLVLGLAAQAQTALPLWSELRASGKLMGEVHAAEAATSNSEWLRVVNSSAQTLNYGLLSIPQEMITRRLLRFQAIGRGQGTGVEAKLELFVHPSERDPFLARGSSISTGPQWHAVDATFDLNTNNALGHDGATLMLALPPKTQVDLTPFHLVQSGEEIDLSWWTERQSALIGGIVGSLVGCLGGLIGILARFPWARRLCLAALLAMGAGGVFALVAGLVAVCSGQPYHVYYPLLLIGVICGPLGLALGPQLRRRYAFMELQRMRALDAAR